MRRSVAVLSFSLLLFLGGCGPIYYTTCPIEMEETDLSEEIRESLESASVCESCDFPEEWWTMFNDPQLTSYIKMALACNPTIKEAASRVEQAYQKALETRAKLLPNIDFLGSGNRQELAIFGFGLPGLVPLVEPFSRVFTTAQMLFDGSFEIDVWGKNRSAYFADVSITHASMADYAQAQLFLSTTIASVYFNLQSHLKQLTLLEANLQDKSEVSDLLWQRFNKGMESEFFLYIEDRDVALQQDQVRVMQALIAEDRHALAALVGNVAQLCESSISLCEPLVAQYEHPFPIPQELSINLISRRPDIMSLLWKISAMTHDVYRAKADFLPSFNLTGELGQISFLITKFFYDQARQITGMATGTLPVYTGGRLQARLGQSQASLEATISQYNQAVLMAVQEVSDQLSNLRYADQRMEDIKAALGDAKSLQILTTQKYESGISTRVAYLNAASNVWVQALTQETIHLTRMQSMVSLIKAIGGGYCGRS